MPPLPSDLRRVLENAVIAARDEATTAAGAALKRLAVEAKDFPPYLTPDERSLRLKLRAAARQLGDPWNADKQAFVSLNKLTHEVAYEHWHRMLFARFLAENNLLIHPEHNVPVDLATVAELAQEEAAKTSVKADAWATAGRFAAAMLPQIFRLDDPALAVQLAPEHQQAMEKILESLPPQVFTADDSLGWVYQFWQSAEKDRVNDTVRAGAKITGETLPAVTQLFTEHYMVLFLLHNTIGAWHAGKVLATPAGQKKAGACTTEQELRDLVALPGYSFEYLRFVADETSPAKWRPAAGAFPGWPRAAKDLNVLDPCCGSGHFLVATLELLVRHRMAEEGLDANSAALAVIQHNLFGLELDARCTQIAAFNVAQAAWKIAGEHFAIPELHVACAGLGPSASLEQWMKLADKNSKAWEGIPSHARQAVTNGLTNLHRLFSQAPELGSLIDPAQLGAEGDLFSADWETMQPFLKAALAQEKDADTHERAVAAQGMAKAAEVLSGEYSVVITNVPYLGFKKQGPVLRAYGESFLVAGKANLSTMFIERFRKACTKAGAISLVAPSNWLLQGSYKRLRTEMLQDDQWQLVGRLGPGAFETVTGEVVNVSLLVVSQGPPPAEHRVVLVDALAGSSVEEKAAMLQDEIIETRLQSDFTKNSDHRITVESIGGAVTLEGIAVSPRGIVNGDNERWTREHWEIVSFAGWRCLQDAVNETIEFGGRSRVIDWSKEGAGMLRPGLDNVAYGRVGVAVSRMGDLPATLYTGELFDQNTAVIVPNDKSLTAALWRYCQDEEFVERVRELDGNLNVTPATLLKVPFDPVMWGHGPDAVLDRLPEPQSDDPTQWLFHGHPAGRVPLTTDPSPHIATVLQVAVVRLVGYKWPGELDEEMRLAPEARAWVEKCKDLDGFADDDGVVPLVNINKERPGHERARALLEAAFGSKWTPGLLNDLLAAAGAPGKSLDDWLRGGDFWAQHCSVFHQRPFVWQIWDGKKDGFNILVHYHRLAAGDGQGHRLLTKITYTYLGDWIAQQQAAAKRGEAGADLRLKAAQDLQKKLESILAGEPPYDIFVRWKPLHEQPIGWNPDINDGVRVNIRPFVTAGVLRGKVNVKWTKDRGKEPESIRPKAQFPWFWSCPEDEPPIDFAGGAKFTGERLNDLHYTRKAKEAARERGGKA